MSQATTPHRWTFCRIGGVDQIKFDKGADILNLDQLDQKLWVALSCPVEGLELDARTLDLLDLDRDGQVRPPEILAATKWLRDVLKDPDCLIAGKDGLTLANVRTDTDEGKTVLRSAQHILGNLGKDGAVLTVADAQKTAEVFAKARLNGDGFVPPSAIADAATQKLAEEVIACCGSEADRSGKPGFGTKQVDAFFAACTEFDGWYKLAEADAKNVMPFGDATPAAHTAFAAVRAKVDDYFGRCRVAAYDARALEAVNREQEVYMTAAAKDLTITADEISHLPIALIAADKPLPLAKAVNPAWADRVTALRNTCFQGKDAVTEAEWIALRARFDPHGAWLAKKVGAAVEPLGKQRVREILAGTGKQALQNAIAEDLSAAPEVDAMTRVEKVVRLHRDFVRLLENYVAFTDFYARRGAIFQAGVLYLDARSCEMCFHVRDAAKHAKMAPMSNAFLAYVDCTRPNGEKKTVACAFTAGDSDNLFEGRNGVFYDRKGRDWDATIAKVIMAPISLRQAFFAPYKTLMRVIQQMFAKRAADAEAASAGKLASGAAAVGDATKAAPPAPPKPKFDVGTIAALGVAVTGIMGIVTAVLTAIMGLGPWVPLGILGIVLAISAPSLFIAWTKLRHRNLGPILDANGWAVNALTRVNIPLGTSLTQLPRIPKGSIRIWRDPYSKRSIWPFVLGTVIVLAIAGYALYRTNVAHELLPNLIPAHHVDNALATADGKTNVSVAAGESVVLAVKSGQTKLLVANDKGGKAMEPLDVVDGKATLVIPADMAPGTLVVSDGSGGSVEVAVTPKK